MLISKLILSVSTSERPAHHHFYLWFSLVSCGRISSVVALMTSYLVLSSHLLGSFYGDRSAIYRLLIRRSASIYRLAERPVGWRGVGTWEKKHGKADFRRKVVGSCGLFCVASDQHYHCGELTFGKTGFLQ